MLFRSAPAQREGRGACSVGSDRSQISPVIRVGSGSAWLQACGLINFHSLSPKDQNITGLWMGKSVSSLDASSVNISLAVFQKGNGELSGLYDCEGSSQCRNFSRGGTLSGRTSSSVFKVDLEDRSWCTFYGGFLPEIADGHYSCYYTDGRIDRGFWNVKLQHWQPPVVAGSSL